MTSTLMVHWLLWGTSLLAGAGAIGALFKLRLAERSLPAWNELQEIDARLPRLREEQRQAGEAAESQRAALAKLESEAAQLRQLREWQEANPDAPARLQQLKTDLERATAELTTAQQNAGRLREESAQLTEQVSVLRSQVGSPEQKKAGSAKALKKAARPAAKRKRKTR